MSPLPIKIDLHVHTYHSADCSAGLEEIIAHSRRRGLDGIAITDHDTVEGALKFLEIDCDGLIIIPGIEVSTVAGHILGINITSPIPAGLPVEETVRRIHDAGGIAVAAHPSAVYKKGIGINEEIASQGIDAVEGINSSVFPFFLLTYLSRRLASRTGLPQIGGSDSHTPETVGLAYTIIENVGKDAEVEEIINAIKEGRCIPHGRPFPWRVRIRRLYGD